MFPELSSLSETVAARSPSTKKWGAKKQPLVLEPKTSLNTVNSFEPIRAINEMDRAVKKSISFRVVATLGTFAVTFAFTGNPFTSIGIATAQAITNTTIYYYHEKHWDSKQKS